MYRCSFIRTEKELETMKNAPSKYEHRKTIHMSWIIDPETYRKLLPPVLEPADFPVVYAYVSVFPHAGFNLPAYNEGGLFLTCKYHGEPGVYCIAMPIQGPNEMGILMGREGYNYPKKNAKVQMDIIGDRVHAVIGRNGIDFFELEGTMGEKHQYFTPKDPAILGKPVAGPCFMLQKDVTTICDDPENDPMGMKVTAIRLVKQVNYNTTYKETPVKLDITLRPSPDDPWVEVAPVDIWSASYADDACEMKGCKLLEEYTSEEDINKLLPYMFTGYDLMGFGYQHEIHW